MIIYVFVIKKFIFSSFLSIIIIILRNIYINYIYIFIILKSLISKLI